MGEKGRFRGVWVAAAWRLTLLSGLLAAAGYCGLLAAQQASRSGRTEQTRLLASPGVCDFGTLNQGDVKETEFELTNGGASPIEVVTVATGCSCQQADIEQKHLPVGGRTRLKVTWRVGNRRGTVADAITLIYQRNGEPDQPPPEKRRLDLVLKAVVYPEVEYTPAKLEFAGGKPGTCVLQLSPGPMQKFTVAGASTNARCLSARYDPVLSQVVVDYSPIDDLDYGAGFVLHVETDAVKQPVLTVPLKVLRAD